MRPALGSNISAPSSNLLRFLRKQSDEVCFFTTNSRTNGTCQTRTPVQKVAHSFSPSSRRLTTASPCKATVESSFFNFDLLRPVPKQRASVHPPFEKGGIPVKSADSPLRCASTDNRPLFKRLWKQKGGKQGADLKPADLPPLPSFLDDVGGTSIGRNKLGKAGNELKLRCTEIDENGNVTTVNGEFKKSELIAKVNRSSIDICSGYVTEKAP